MNFLHPIENWKVLGGFLAKKVSSGTTLNHNKDYPQISCITICTFLYSSFSKISWNVHFPSGFFGFHWIGFQRSQRYSLKLQFCSIWNTVFKCCCLSTEERCNDCNLKETIAKIVGMKPLFVSSHGCHPDCIPLICFVKDLQK